MTTKSDQKVEVVLPVFDFPSEHAAREQLAIVQFSIDGLHAQLSDYHKKLNSREYKHWRAQTLAELAQRNAEARAIKTWLRDNPGKVDFARINDVTTLALGLFNIVKEHVPFAELDEDEQDDLIAAQEYLIHALGTSNLGQVH